MAAKHALKTSTPLINLRFLPMKHNEHEIAMLEDFARSLGVDVLTLKTLNPYHGGECDSANAKGNEFVPENILYQRFIYNPTDGSRIRRRKNPCKTLWNNPTIHWDGKMSPCTFDPHGHYVVGDLKTAAFKEIWWGAHCRKLRRRFREDYASIGLCSECTCAFEGGALSTDIIAEAHFFNKPIRDAGQLPQR
ncbi:MAG: SPASM domain-containing protein [Deltaproteobacteria bacterium]|nr:SPASM domain-containing protein [Deltaproteobacteria bacterium]